MQVKTRGASLPLIAGLPVTFGVPPEGPGILIGVDHLIDMAGIALNAGADVVMAAMVAQREAMQRG